VWLAGMRSAETSHLPRGLPWRLPWLGHGHSDGDAVVTAAAMSSTASRLSRWPRRRESVAGAAAVDGRRGGRFDGRGRRPLPGRRRTGRYSSTVDLSPISVPPFWSGTARWIGALFG